MVGKRQKINFQDNLRAKILASLTNDEDKEKQGETIISAPFEDLSDSAKTEHHVDTNVDANIGMDGRRNVLWYGDRYGRTLAGTFRPSYGLTSVPTVVGTIKNDSSHLKTQKMFSKQQSTIFQYLLFASETISEESGRIVRQGYSNAKIISCNTGISFRTCQGILKKLALWGLIEKHNFQKANWKGFHFIILEENGYCGAYVHTHGLEYGHTHGLEYGNLHSSSLNNKLTTKPKEYISDYLPVDNFLEMGFWQLEPNIVTQKQFQVWLEEFKLTPGILITYLDRCRFEMVELGKEEKLNKGSAVNWFYGVMKKRGGSYPEPPGYKSLAELKIEEEKKIIKKLEEQFAEKEELKVKKEFYETMKNPQCELYKACFNALGDFGKSFGKDSKAFQEGIYVLFTKMKSQQGKLSSNVSPLSAKPQE
jgi:hypothetical protein